MNKKIAQLLLVLAIVASLLGGCAAFDKDASPREQYLFVLDAYIPTLQALVVLHDEGVISEDEWRGWVIPTVQRTRHLRAILDAQTQAGIPIRDSETLKALITEIRKLIQFKLRKEAERKEKPSVDPTPSVRHPAGVRPSGHRASDQYGRWA